jgi:hypothetical protein
MTATVDAAGATVRATDWAAHFYKDLLHIVGCEFRNKPTRFWLITFARSNGNERCNSELATRTVRQGCVMLWLSCWFSFPQRFFTLLLGGSVLFVRSCLKVMRQVFRADKLHLRISKRQRICLGACERCITDSREQKDLIYFRMSRVIERVHLARPFVNKTGVISPFNKPAKVGVAQRGRTMSNEC